MTPKPTPPEYLPSPSSGTFDRSRPLGVYVHFPFCASRCPYCDFAVTARRQIPHADYASAVLAELRSRAPWYDAAARPRLVSIYFGGGTPGLWQPDCLGQVLQGIRETFPAQDCLEITVEANPGDLGTGQLGRIREHGINRLSFGAQAFQDRLLGRIGRRHDAKAIRTAFESAREAGFDNLCLDLMFGLPDQQPDDWRASIHAALALEPEHITAYALTVEPRTRFGALDRAGKLDRPGDESVAGMYSLCHDLLTRSGYEHYEISSFAKPGRRSVHNSLYWTMGAYLGLGVSASSFRPLAGKAGGWRFSNPRTVEAYLQSVAQNQGSVAPAEVELRSHDQLEDEALWLGLRMADGVDRLAHARQYGFDPLAPAERRHAAERCAGAKWLQITPERLRLLPGGFLFADEVAVRLGRGAAAEIAAQRDTLADGPF